MQKLRTGRDLTVKSRPRILRTPRMRLGYSSNGLEHNVRPMGVQGYFYRKIVEDLIKILKYEYKAIPWEVIEALGALGNAYAVEPLLQVLIPKYFIVISLVPQLQQPRLMDLEYMLP